MVLIVKERTNLLIMIKGETHDLPDPLHRNSSSYYRHLGSRGWVPPILGSASHLGLFRRLCHGRSCDSPIIWTGFPGHRHQLDHRFCCRPDLCCPILFDIYRRCSSLISGLRLLPGCWFDAPLPGPRFNCDLGWTGWSRGYGIRGSGF